MIIYFWVCGFAEYFSSWTCVDLIPYKDCFSVTWKHISEVYCVKAKPPHIIFVGVRNYFKRNITGWSKAKQDGRTEIFLVPKRIVLCYQTSSSEKSDIFKIPYYYTRIIFWYHILSYCWGTLKITDFQERECFFPLKTVISRESFSNK